MVGLIEDYSNLVEGDFGGYEMGIEDTPFVPRLRLRYIGNVV
jgi:hypothetical protein